MRKNCVLFFFQTLVIGLPTSVGRQLAEEEFWHSAARLAQAVLDKKLLIGGGICEEHCAHLLLSGSHLLLSGAHLLLSGAHLLLSVSPLLLSGAPLSLSGAHLLLSGGG